LKKPNRANRLSASKPPYAWWVLIIYSLFGPPLGIVSVMLFIIVVFHVVASEPLPPSNQFFRNMPELFLASYWVGGIPAILTGLLAMLLRLKRNLPGIAAQVQHNLRCGWYLRVLQSGHIQAGDSVHLLARPYAEWPLSRILELIDSRNCQPQAMREVLQLPLPPSWQHMFQRRLDTGECEDWQRRLFG